MRLEHLLSRDTYYKVLKRMVSYSRKATIGFFVLFAVNLLFNLRLRSDINSLVAQLVRALH